MAAVRGIDLSESGSTSFISRIGPLMPEPMPPSARKASSIVAVVEMSHATQEPNAGQDPGLIYQEE
jgi:hypothetical protein